MLKQVPGGLTDEGRDLLLKQNKIVLKMIEEERQRKPDKKMPLPRIAASSDVKEPIFGRSEIEDVVEQFLKEKGILMPKDQ